MDLTARITAVEEEVSVLKGEIKSILQEVRTAVLARDNPFASGVLELPVALPPAPAPVAPTPPAAETATAASSNGHSVPALHEVPAPAKPEPAMPPSMVKVVANAPAEVAPEPRQPQRWSVHSLAALMSWTQESAERFSAQDLGIVLSLARYGGLIEKDLEDTLASLAESLAPEEQPHRASGTDFLLALRQLDALLDEAGQPHQIEQPARRAS